MCTNDLSNGYQVMLDTEELVTVRWEQVEGWRDGGRLIAGHQKRTSELFQNQWWDYTNDPVKFAAWLEGAMTRFDPAEYR